MAPLRNTRILESEHMQHWRFLHVFIKYAIYGIQHCKLSQLMSIIHVCPSSIFFSRHCIWKLFHELEHVFMMNDLYGACHHYFQYSRFFISLRSNKAPD